MPSWNELLEELERQPSDPAKNDWIRTKQSNALAEISRLREGRNVIFYASAFLQKPQLPPDSLQLTNEELNGLMSVMHGMNS